MAAFYTRDALNDIKVPCIADDWKIIPKCHPEGLAELSLSEKLADLEGKLKVLMYTLGDIKFDAVHNNQKITALESDSKLQLIQHCTLQQCTCFEQFYIGF